MKGVIDQLAIHRRQYLHEVITHRCTDTDRFWFSFGGNYAFSENSNVDLGVSILRGKTQNFSEKDSLAASLGQDVSWEYESKGHAVLVGAQYNYKF